jgi:hypothetical protein
MSDETQKVAAPIPNEERAHHPYSPSSLQNLEACPCYRNRQGEVHEAAIKGTLQHAVTETGEDDHRLDDDEAGMAAECMDYYQREKMKLEELRNEEDQRRAAQARAEGKDMYLPPDYVLDLTEIYLPIDDKVFVDMVWISEDGSVGKDEAVQATTAGYVDRALVSWDRRYAVLLDWKFGAWAVEKASNNLQGIAYALGLFRKFPTLEEVRFVFKQPQLDYITEATFKKSDVPALYLRVQTVVARAREARKHLLKDDFSMAQPHVPVCNFCALIGKCPKVAAIACKVAHKFYPTEIPEDVTPTVVRSPEQTAIALRLCQVMAVWAKAVKTVISDRAIREQKFPDGYILVSKSDREIADPAKFKEIALQYVTPDELATAAKYSFGPVEKAVSEKAPRGEKSAAVEQFKKALEDSGAVKRGDPYSFLKAVSKKGGE